MSANRILDAFDRLGDEPETIKQFRKLVIGLATSGKLVTASDPSHSAAHVLDYIKMGDQDLLRRAFTRKSVESENSSTAISTSSKIEGPTKFARLGEVARVEKGQTGIANAIRGPYPLVVTAAQRETCDHFDFDGAAAIVPLVSSVGHGRASLQRLHYQEGKFALGSILAAIFPHTPELISARFIFEYLTALKDELLITQMIGTANVSLSIGKISEILVPLVPPLVQRKVDELMRLCDKLVAARMNREVARDRLAAVSLTRLGVPETFQAAARFALDTLPALTARPNQIKLLRQTILNLAVRGKLVPQDASDEPAAELLARMDKIRGIIVAKRKIKGTPPRSSLVELENFDLPTS